MSFATLISDRKHAQFTDSTDPALVHFEGGTPLVVSRDQPKTSASWPLRFVLAASLGVVGGLAAAIALNPSPDRFPAFQQQWADTRIATPISQTPLETPIVAANLPAATPVKKSSAGRTPAHVAPEEVSRLKTRNRRLEALVRILRQRKADSDLNASSITN